MQLPGKPCCICQQPISGRTDGEFCERCGVPIHRGCATAGKTDGSCIRCGAGRDAVARWEDAHLSSAGRRQWADGASLTRHGLLLALTGLVTFCGGILVPVYAYFVSAAGLVMLVVGLANVVRGRRKLKDGRERMADGDRAAPPVSVP